jgi:heme-degrading monooxygenase HmoA
MEPFFFFVERQVQDFVAVSNLDTTPEQERYCSNLELSVVFVSRAFQPAGGREFNFMYVVIFRAKAGKMDADYATTAARLRELAFASFGCLDFVFATEGDQEIALSYWRDEESIKKWKAHSEHVLAQELGRAKWYASYIVQVAEIKREYQFNHEQTS